MDGFKNMKPVRYVIQTILPQVYTDALSNQELLSKIVSHLNDLIKNNNELPDFIQETVENYITSGAINDVVNDILVNFMLNVKNPPNNLKPASGDGTEDDTEAIQGCIDYARDMGGGCVYFPNGVYLTQPLVLYDNVSLFGFDRYSSKLVLKGGANTHMFTGNVTNTSITGMTIDGNMDIQVNNLNLIDIVADELILQNLVLTDGYVLVNAVVNKTSQISNVIFDYAVVKHMEISGEGLVLGNNLYLHDISAIKGQNLVSLNTSNSVLSNIVSNGEAPVGFIINGNNNSVSGTFDNAVVPFQDNGQNNTIINNGKTEQLKITGNRNNNVGGNEIDNITGKKEINANDIILNTNNPLEYKTPSLLNSYFKTIPFKDKDSEYLVLVKGEKDIELDVNEKIEEIENILNSSVSEIENNINIIEDDVASLVNSLNDEINNREDSFNTLQDSINVEKGERESKDLLLQNEINSEIDNRKAEDDSIWDYINNMPSPMYINVKDYGAKGDGTTDDTTSIQNAIDFISNKGGVLFFPNGIYMVNTFFIKWDALSITFLGEGRRSIIKSKTPVDMFTFDTSKGATLNFHKFTDLCFDGGSLVGTGALIKLRNTSVTTIERCHFRNLQTQGYGIVLGGDQSTATHSHDNIIRDNYFDTSTGFCALDIEQYAADYQVSGNFMQLRFGVDYCIRITNSGTGQFFDNHIYNAKKNVVLIDGGTKNVLTFSNNFFDNSLEDIFVFDGTTTSIAGGYICLDNNIFMQCRENYSYIKFVKNCYDIKVENNIFVTHHVNSRSCMYAEDSVTINRIKIVNNKIIDPTFANESIYNFYSSGNLIKDNDGYSLKNNDVTWLLTNGTWVSNQSRNSGMVYLNVYAINNDGNIKITTKTGTGTEYVIVDELISLSTYPDNTKCKSISFSYVWGNDVKIELTDVEVKNKSFIQTNY